MVFNMWSTSLTRRRRLLFCYLWRSLSISIWRKFSTSESSVVVTGGLKPVMFIGKLIRRPTSWLAKGIFFHLGFTFFHLLIVILVIS
ncbi:hypothetical protein LINPERPRIM_LOCUS34660 [Linum perenne]